ncbi:MAG: hypothetical protein Pars92KO_24750 [Parasphingorhabdus sp.]
MTDIATKLGTYWALGVENLLRVARYRYGLKTGFHPVQSLKPVKIDGKFFNPAESPPVGETPPDNWKENGHLFGHIPIETADTPPNWLTNHLTGASLQEPLRPWWEIADFDVSVGDIKTIWELSRWHWLLPMAQRARNGDLHSLKRMNIWLSDWNRNNPQYLGPNWKCGQEASIRLIHLASAAMIMDSHLTPCNAIYATAEAHVQRIAPTLSYAAAQDNNHGTSEAVAMFIGASWLLNKEPNSQYTKWLKTGRKRIEERVNRLIGPDGSFSQHSVNYHRMMLDCLSIAEVWRRKFDLPRFSENFYSHAAAATAWLAQMMNLRNGDAPNIGANDGAQLIPFADTPYRDYRPAVQLASALFLERALPGEGAYNSASRWLDISQPEQLLERSDHMVFDDGGYAVLRKEDAKAVIRYPRFNFRPSQNDALHVDLWIKGQNILRDGGTYSYNDGEEWIGYFGGGKAHNTILFDCEEAMPRISRFLLAKWLRTKERNLIFDKNNDILGFEASYLDYKKRYHHRKITLNNYRMAVVDTIKGFSKHASLRWRFAPDDWRLEGENLIGRRGKMQINANVELSMIALETGYESRHYMEKTELPVLHVQVQSPAVITSIFEWN